MIVVALTACAEQKKNVWYKGNTHTHSTYSDGDTNVKDVIKWYHDHHYHFLFVTDHNIPLNPDTINLGFDKRQDFILISGNEVTDDQVIHTSALNTTTYIPTISNYRKKLNDGKISDTEFQSLPDTRAGILAKHVKDILDAGGLPVLNHPNFVSGVQVADILPVQELKHIELFNGHPSVYNWGNNLHSAVEVKWDSVLIHGKLLYGIASDDEHNLKQIDRERANPGRGWIMVHAASLNSENIMHAISSGDFYSSTGVFLKSYSVKNNIISVVVDEKATLNELNAGRGYPRKDLKDATTGFTIEFIGYNGKVIQGAHSTKAKYTIQPNDKYVRVRISYNIDIDGHFDTYYAWTQPVEAEKGFFNPSQPYFFVHLTDPQLGMMENNESFSKESEMVAHAVSAINRLNPAFVVITGDLVHQDGNMEQINELKRLFDQVEKTIPVYYLPGNHDVGQTVPKESLALFRANFGNDRFSTLYKNTGLIGFNSQIVWAKRDTLENEQYQWLENELKKFAENTHRFVFAHHPLFVETTDEADKYQNLPVDRRGKYIDLLNKYNVQYMFVGHLHKNNISQTENLTIVATNALCVSHSTEPSGFRIVKVYPDLVVSDFYSVETLPEIIDL